MISNIDLINIANKYNIPLNSIFQKNEPSNNIYHGGYIINLDDTNLERGGTHWTGLYVNDINHSITYFDSFGFPPSQSTINWINLINPYYQNYDMFYNSKQIQNIRSGGCGIYSLFFIDFMNKHRQSLPANKVLKKFLNLFDNDVTKNLTILKHLVPYYKVTND